MARPGAVADDMVVARLLTAVGAGGCQGAVKTLEHPGIPHARQVLVSAAGRRLAAAADTQMTTTSLTCTASCTSYWLAIMVQGRPGADVVRLSLGRDRDRRHDVALS